MRKHTHHLIWSIDEQGVGIHCAHCNHVAHEFVPVDWEGDRERVKASQRAHREWHERVSDPSESL